MLARKVVFWSVGRSTTVGAVTALALSAIEPTVALASKGTSVTTSAATDFSARRKSYRQGSYRGGAAAAVAFGAIVGTGIAAAAAANRRANYDEYYGSPAPAPAPITVARMTTAGRQEGPVCRFGSVGRGLRGRRIFH